MEGDPKLIPKVNAYKNTKVSANRTRFEVEEMLEKKYKVTKTIWKKDDPQNSYFGFEYIPESGKALIYKVQVPFIEKEEREQKNNRYSPKTTVYDAERSYRFFYHIFKALMLNTDIGMGFEQMMASYLVVGELKDGTPQNVLDKVTEVIMDPERKALELK